MLGKKILLGVTGGIAAYKIPTLVRHLKKKGADVTCILTEEATEFVSPLVLNVLSGNPVYTHFRDAKDGSWVNHVDLALRADVLLMAPLTANTLAKMTSGLCDNLLMAVYLSMKSKTIVAPAMDLDMYQHPTTKANLAKLESFGNMVIPAANGELASGLSGQGRMEEPEQIVQIVEDFFQNDEPHKALSGKKILITAGPTYEALDPVRFLGNRSSGKMGFELAEVCLNLGADVYLISGPTKLQLTHPCLQIVKIQSADEMYVAVQRIWPVCNVGIFSAAVADYKPKNRLESKQKKHSDEWVIELVRNPDILAWAGEHKRTNQYLVGFALETENLLENGREKLTKKKADLIVMNSLEDFGAGFEVDTNRISLLDKNNNFVNFELKPKSEVAKDIVNYLIEQIQ